MLSDWHYIKEEWWNRLCDVGGLSVPFAFWMLSKSIFDDSFKFDRRYLGIYIMTISASFYFTYFDGLSYLSGDETLVIMARKMHHGISIVFLVLGLIEAFRNKNEDLLDSRRNFRNIFIIIVALIMGITLLAELTLTKQHLALWPTLFQKSVILILTFWFSIKMWEIRHGFFLDFDLESDKPQYEHDPKLIDAFQRAIKEEKIYLKENITIRELSERIGQKEYKVRRYINQQLNFKNFNDFLNSYRVQDACEILLDGDKKDLTILEIAYQLGYASIGPFNGAFKCKTGMTPSQYRRQDQS